MESYHPTALDIAWAIALTDILRDGGVWVFPATFLIYRINKQTRRMTLLNPAMLDDPECLIMHERGRRVFSSIDYTIEP